jgi:hypothetical protein
LENSSLTLFPAEFPTVPTASTTITDLKKEKAVMKDAKNLDSNLPPAT